jgi:peptidoglycan/LPS O-acetylase OafA/YrhL
MVWLGQWSYALYLIHATIIYALIEWIGPRSTSVANVGWLGVVTVVCVAASAALYYAVEHPVEQYLRNLQSRRTRVPEPVGAEPLPGLTPGS